jgi:hypothetical protein
MTTACLLLTMMLAIDKRTDASQGPLESRAREFVASFTAGKFDAASKDFNASMRAVVTPSALAAMKEHSEIVLGSFRAITAVRQRHEGDFRVVEIECSYEKSPASFRVAFDAEDLVGALFLDPIRTEPVDPLLEAAARALLKDFVAGDFEAMRKQFDTKLRYQLHPLKLATLRTQVATSYGKFRSVKEVHQITDAPYRNIDLIAEYDRSSVLFRVAFDSAARVTGVRLAPVERDQ